MHRNDALEFIRDNSRELRSAELGRFEVSYRLGNNGRSFILLNMHEDGWELYFPDGTIDTEIAIKSFCEHTGCKMP